WSESKPKPLLAQFTSFGTSHKPASGQVQCSQPAPQGFFVCCLERGTWVFIASEGSTLINLENVLRVVFPWSAEGYVWLLPVTPIRRAVNGAEPHVGKRKSGFLPSADICSMSWSKP